jgi:hypothetical protein
MPGAEYSNLLSFQPGFFLLCEVIGLNIIHPKLSVTATFLRALQGWTLLPTDKEIPERLMQRVEGIRAEEDGLVVRRVVLLP